MTPDARSRGSLRAIVKAPARLGHAGTHVQTHGRHPGAAAARKTAELRHPAPVEHVSLTSPVDPGMEFSY